MWVLLNLVLDKLAIKSEATKALKEQIKNLQGNRTEAAVMLNELEVEARLNNCTKCDSRHFRSFFLACIYYELGVIEKTQYYIKRAIRDFYFNGSTWNELLVNWVYGETFLLLNRELPARRELEHTIEMLEEMAKKYRRKNQYKKRDECNAFIIQIKRRLENNVQGDGGRTFESKSKSESPSPPPPNYLPWRRSQIIFPVQNQIRAGREGNFIFESQPDFDAILDELAFNEEIHYFYNLREEGNPVFFNPKVYRWFRIEGNSMNQVDPIPIMHEDYVLAIDLSLSSIDVQLGSIVVAELYNPLPNERAGVLKKYTANGLASRSSEEYPIIPLDEASIRGVAVAVAKPILDANKLAGSPCLNRNEYTVVEEVEYEAVDDEVDRLYKDLLAKVFHDHSTAKRLIEHERKQTPNAETKVLIQNAIDRWMRDNR